MLESRRLRLTKHVAHMEAREMHTWLWRENRKEEENIKMYRREIRFVAWTGVFRLRIQTVGELL
jgi:hypothetical protein